MARSEALKEAQKRYRAKQDKYENIKKINAKSNKKKYAENEEFRERAKRIQKEYYKLKKEKKKQDDVWVCFDVDGNMISNTHEENYNLLDDLTPEYFDVSTCYVVKNPEGWEDGCCCCVKDGKVMCMERTRERDAEEMEIFRKRFNIKEPVDEVAELKDQVAELKSTIDNLLSHYNE